MKTKNKTIFLILARIIAVVAIMAITLVSCDFDKKEPQPQEQQLDPIDPAFIDFLSAQKEVDVPLSAIILPNGESVQAFYDKIHKNKGARITDIMADAGPQAKKNTLITEMIHAGSYMTTDIEFKDVNPVQKRIAYSYGSRDYKIAQSPTGGSCNRDKKIHGLDCSGFIYQMAKAADLDLSSSRTAQQLSDPAVWEKAIQAKGDEYKKIRVEDVSKEVVGNDSKLQTGDILLFYNQSGGVHHIAMVLKEEPSGIIYFLNSYGNPDKQCDTHFAKGPAKLLIDKKSWFDNGFTYGVLRVVTDISGNWEVGIRCTGQSYDAIKYRVEFISSKNDDNVTGSGKGVDYDGETEVEVKFKGQYQKDTNILKGKMVFNFPADPSQNREDSFSVKLNHDDTGYFDAAKVIDNGGCQIQLKLINLEK